jgi:hypothetical protein
MNEGHNQCTLVATKILDVFEIFALQNLARRVLAQVSQLLKFW